MGDIRQPKGPMKINITELSPDALTLGLDAEAARALQAIMSAGLGVLGSKHNGGDLRNIQLTEGSLNAIEAALILMSLQITDLYGLSTADSDAVGQHVRSNLAAFAKAGAQIQDWLSKGRVRATTFTS